MKKLRKLFLNIIVLLTSFQCFAADDISMTSVIINELTLEYEKVQLSQAQELTFKCYLNNIASFDHTGIYVNLKIVDSYHDTIYNNSSPSIIVAAQSNDSVEVSIPFNAPEAGKYTFLFEMFQDIPDAVPGNNTASLNMYVDDHIFQRDNGEILHSNSYLVTDDYYEIGNMYEVHRPGNITSASAYIDVDTEIGTTVYFSLYEVDSWSFYLHDMTYDYQITAEDLGDTLTLNFYNPTPVSGDYPLVLTVGTWGASGDDLVIGIAQNAAPFTSFYMDNSSSWYNINGTPVVRMNFDYIASVGEEFDKSWNIYPNPASRSCKIDFMDNEPHLVVITDVSGKKLIQQTFSSGGEIDVSQLPSGIYFVEVNEMISKLVIE